MVTPASIVEHLIRAHQTENPQTYDDTLHTHAAQLRTLPVHALALVLHRLITEVAEARDAELEAQAKRRHLA